MSPADVISHFGTQVNVASALGITQPTVSEWVQNGYVPLGRQYEIQVLTGGKLKADPASVKRTTVE